MFNKLPEEIFTLVDENGNPVYTDLGMDGKFETCFTLGDMLTFTRTHGWSQMMEMARWSKGEGRTRVFPARVTLKIEKIPVE